MMHWRKVYLRCFLFLLSPSRMFPIHTSLCNLSGLINNTNVQILPWWIYRDVFTGYILLCLSLPEAELTDETVKKTCFRADGPATVPGHYQLLLRFCQARDVIANAFSFRPLSRQEVVCRAANHLLSALISGILGGACISYPVRMY